MSSPMLPEKKTNGISGRISRASDSAVRPSYDGSVKSEMMRSYSARRSADFKFLARFGEREFANQFIGRKRFGDENVVVLVVFQVQDAHPAFVCVRFHNFSAARFIVPGGGSLTIAQNKPSCLTDSTNF